MSSDNFAGLRVISFESRKSEEIRRLILRLEGKPMVAPSMREVPLTDQDEALRFGERLLAGTVDVVILLTGVGTRILLSALATRYPKERILIALTKIPLVARGPKPIVALAEVGLKPTIAVPEPNTWRDLLATVDAQHPLQGLRVAVQEYGVTNAELIAGLKARAAEVLRVPVYQWALPEDVTPLRHAIEAICTRQADVVMFTSANQVHHVMRMAQSMGQEHGVRDGLVSCVVASIGPICSATLRDYQLLVDLEPHHPKMGSLLSETARAAHALLASKQRRAT